MFAPASQVPLAPLTTWKIGGPAEWYAEPKSEAELRAALEWAGQRGLPVHLLGRGSNVLIADAGLSGLVVCLRALHGEGASEPEPDRDGLLTVPAGLSLPRLSKLAARHGFSGYEFYIGIPGTVGGAAAMNAGFGPGDERQTAARCREVQVLDRQGNLEWRPYADFHPVYRHTDLLRDGGDTVVVRARFFLNQPATRETIRRETAEHLAMRRERQPLTRPTAGSVFKGTPEGVPAGLLIDRCGLKGFQVGGAAVSRKHANWIENLGGATAVDVLAVIHHVQEVVERRETVRLETEVRFLH